MEVLLPVAEPVAELAADERTLAHFGKVEEDEPLPLLPLEPDELLEVTKGLVLLPPLAELSKLMVP